MRDVLDSNVALKWVLPENDDVVAARVRDEFRQGLDELLAPDGFPVEVGHALAKAERQGKIRVGDGATKVADVFRYMPALHTSLPLLARGFAIASQARIGVYDCLYVALAEREGCEVLTGDTRLKNSLPGRPI